MSKVGQNWDEVHSEAVARLDDAGPIFWMVALGPEARRRFFRSGDNSYFSGLYVTDDNRLAMVDPDLTPHGLRPDCGCCIHTRSGKSFTRAFDPDVRLTSEDARPK